MKKLILLFILTSAVIGYSQDTIITEKRVYTGEIILVSKDYLSIKTSKDIWHDVNFKKIAVIKTSNLRANEAFELYKNYNKNDYTAPNGDILTDISTNDKFSNEYNAAHQTLNRFNSQRKGGKIAMIGGGVLAVAGGVMAGVGGYQGKAGLSIAGSVVAGAGGLSFLVGLFCWIDGQIKYYNSKNELNLIKFKRSSISTDGAKISLNF